ncbi:MAG: AsmA family protein [Verrucomicrobia bacterium]|nr:AsmA family protein [Verrucomicrobiota bacterium]
MKRLFRWLFRLVVLLIVLAVALVLLKDILLKAIVERRIREQTGLEVKIAKLEAGLFSPTFLMEDFKLYNPPEFGGSVFLDVPEVRFEYDAGEAVRGRLHFRLLRLNLKELHTVRSQSGRTNLLGLVAQAQRRAPAQPPSDGGLKLEFGGIDRLYLSFGTVKHTDLQQPRNNWQRTIGWKDYEVKNICTEEDLRNWATLVLMQVTFLHPAQAVPGR